MSEKGKKTDRRTSRTKKALRDALIELILEKHYDAITVQDIIDRADVGRSTFYLHFRDKEDLLIGDWKKFLGLLADNFNWSGLWEARLVPIRELFHHLVDFHTFYRALEKSQKSERLFKTGCRFLAENIETQLTKNFEASELKIPAPILANYLANEIFGQLRWWLDGNMKNSPEEMDEIFHSLVMPGVRNSFVKFDKNNTQKIAAVK